MGGINARINFDGNIIYCPECDEVMWLEADDDLKPMYHCHNHGNCSRAGVRYRATFPMAELEEING